MAKVTNSEARKVLKAMNDYYGSEIFDDKDDAPFIPDDEYKWGRSTDAAEIIWESGEYEWTLGFCDWIYSQKRYYKLGDNIIVEPYNSFIIQISKF